MPLRVLSTGNAGVYLENGAGRIYIDAFFYPIPGAGNAPSLRGSAAGPADLILITHAHYDHMHPEETRDAALASGAVVAGPAEAIRILEPLLPSEKLVILESPERKRPPTSASARFGDINVTSYRTYHGRGHNSYVIEMGGMRIFHDADNERTQYYNLDAIGPVDLLLMCPWAGSGSGQFVEKLKPRAWLLIHMTDEEIEQHLNDAFLPALINPVPPGVVALRGGEVWELL